MVAERKERPILFSSPMVRAILAGTKTQTRRLVKVARAYDSIEPLADYPGEWSGWSGGERYSSILCPYGKPGDRLWVRETWREDSPDDPTGAIYKADAKNALLSESLIGFKWKPSIFMPRWASRITLEVTGVRVERLQEISEVDAIAEGLTPHGTGYAQGWQVAGKGLIGNSPQNTYQHLWDSLNATRAPWASNPWVWVVEFKRV